MAVSRSRAIVAAAPIVALVWIASTLQLDGELRPVDPDVDVTIRDSSSWYAPPSLAARGDDPDGVYVIVPELPATARLSAVRVDARTGEQSQPSGALGPLNAVRGFVASPARAQLLGLRFGRPAFHLLSLPDGRGPGIHYTDSATGRLDVLAGDRRLATRWVFNSSTIAELLSLTSAEPGGGRLAALTRTDEGWRLFLYEQRAAASRRADDLEES
jgi:hypothetical protein